MYKDIGVLFMQKENENPTYQTSDCFHKNS